MHVRVCARGERGKGKAILVASRKTWSFPAVMEVTQMGPSSLPELVAPCACLVHQAPCYV